MKELVQIQASLNAPKDKHNKFANFDYRSAEDILGAVKPLLKETGCSLTLTDDIVLVGDRYYIKSTATLTNGTGEKEVTTGYAREAEVKKGSDDAQITGACSSYARKYALCGLFAIDDSKADPDNGDNTKRGTSEDPSKRTKTTATAAAAATPATTAAPKAAAKEEKEKPLIQDGNALWAKAIEFCVKNNRKAADLRRSYTISDADMLKLQEIIDFQKEYIGN